jgi:hypothetical protein
VPPLSPPLAARSSLPALLQACAPLLSRSPHARLRLESIVAHRLQQGDGAPLPPQQFVESCLALPASTLEALLGLRILSGELLPDTKQPVMRMEWAPAPGPRPPGDAPGSAPSAPPPAACCLTGPGLFLELKPAFSRLVAALAAPAAKAGQPPRDWPSYGSPATSWRTSWPWPAAAPRLLAALLRSAAGSAGAWAGLFELELLMHAGIQQAELARCGTGCSTRRAGPHKARISTMHCRCSCQTQCHVYA